LSRWQPDYSGEWPRAGLSQQRGTFALTSALHSGSTQAGERKFTGRRSAGDRAHLGLNPSAFEMQHRCYHRDADVQGRIRRAYVARPRSRRLGEFCFPRLPFLRTASLTVNLPAKKIILVPSALTGMLAGNVSDKISRKRAIGLGAAIFGVGSALSAGAKKSLAMLIVGRCVAGAGEGLFLGCLCVALFQLFRRR
jgi:hypothetical protein